MKTCSKRSMPLITASVAALVSLVGCYAEIHETHPYPDNSSGPIYYPSQPSSDSKDSSSKHVEPPVNALCRNQTCRKVNVFVIYTLREDLGQGNNVVLEAFDNSRFEGSPQATALISGFDASGSGSISEGQLMLTPGKYYIRAFISQQSATAAPYEYGGMKLVSNKPVGYYGAASGAHSILVGEKPTDEAPLTIKLNYLFKSDEKEVPSDANLRIQFTTAQDAKIESSRKLRIELRDTSDFAATPKASYSLPSDSLLVSGRIGKAEFVARNLIPAKYTVLAYIDTNDNEYPDAEEMKQSTAAGFITIAGKRTETISMQLQ